MDKLNFDKFRNAVDDVKNKVLAENDSERRVCEALSNKNWGASSTLMNDIARDTYDFQMYGPIMSILWSALEAPKREWRKVFKALGLLEHLIKHGTELVVEDSRDRIYRIRALTNFSYQDGNNDKGTGIREKAKQLMDLLKDNEYIREERNKARKLRNKFVGVGGGGGAYSDYAGGGEGYYNDGYDRGGGGGYQNRRDPYNRSNGSLQRRVEVSRTGRYRDSTHMECDQNEPGYQEKDTRDDGDDGDDGEKHSSTSAAHSSKQNVKRHGSKTSVLTKDTRNIDRTTSQQSITATGSGKGEDLLGAENNFADFSNAPPITQNTVKSQVVTPEEDEWDAFKSSSPAPPMSAPPAVEVKAAQPLSDIYQGRNSAFPEPSTLLAEVPPVQQISQHTDNPFHLLSMGQQGQQRQTQVHPQQQQQVGFGSTGPDANSAVGRRLSTNSSGDVQEWGSSYLANRPIMSFTGSAADFQAAPGSGGSAMLSVGKKEGTDDNGLSSLVNLGGLQTNALQRQQSMDGKNALCDLGRTTSSFQGLDGFVAQPQGTMSSLDPNMNSYGSPHCDLDMVSPASSGYPIQQQSWQPQTGATGLPQQQQMAHSGQWPVMGNPSIQQQHQPGMMGSGMPTLASQRKK